jgi:hypothetical protein
VPPLRCGPGRAELAPSRPPSPLRFDLRCTRFTAPSRPRHSCGRRLTRTSALLFSPDQREVEWRTLRSTGRWWRPRVTRHPMLYVFTTTLLTSGPSRALSSKCTLPGFTSSTPSPRGTKSTTATGSETTRAALKGLRRAEQWELAHSVRERWPDPRNPVRANLDFFIPCGHDPWLCKVSHATYGSFRSREELAARSSVASWSRQRIMRPHG